MGAGQDRRRKMYRYIVRRAIFAVPVILISSVLVFFIIRKTFDPLGGAAINTRADTKAIA